MLEETDQKNIKFAVLFFTLSTVITWWFIAVAPIYDSFGQQLLSCGIASAKWSIQIIAALVFLENRKWAFIRNISFTCLLGSFILVPYSVFGLFGMYQDSSYFLASLIVSVMVMIVSYRFSVRKSGVERHWWAGWLFCLAVAVTLQLKLVFNINILQP